MHHLMTLNRKRIRMTPMPPIQNAPTSSKRRKRSKRRRIVVGCQGARKRWLWRDSLRANADIHFALNTVTPTLTIAMWITRRNIRRIWQRTIRRSISKKSRRSESIRISAVFWMHKLRILSVRDVLSIWNKVALSSCPLWLPLDYVFCADHDNDCLISSPSSSRPFRMDLSVGLVLKNRESNHQTHCLPNVPSKSCSTYPFVSPPLLVSIIGDKYQCSVSVTARTDSPYYRRPPYAFMPCTKCNEIHDARTQCADDTELEMSKWWMTWNWKEQICAAKCLMTKWRIFAEHVCSGCHWLFVDELYCFTVSLCVFGVLSVFLLLVFDWSYYNLFGGTFILKLLFKLLCAQTVDISMICTFWTWTCRSPTILLVYDEELTVAMSPMRHPLSIPFLILPKCTTMRDPSFLFDFIDSMFECSFVDAVFFKFERVVFSHQVTRVCAARSSSHGVSRMM